MSYTPAPHQTPILEEMIFQYACPLDKEGIWSSKELPEHGSNHEDMSFPQIVKRLVDLMIDNNEPMELRLELAKETKAWIQSLPGLNKALSSIDTDMGRLTGLLDNDPTYYVHHKHHPIPGSNGIEMTRYTPKQSTMMRAPLPPIQPGA